MKANGQQKEDGGRVGEGMLFFGVFFLCWGGPSPMNPSPPPPCPSTPPPRSEDRHHRLLDTGGGGVACQQRASALLPLRNSRQGRCAVLSWGRRGGLRLCCRPRHPGPVGEGRCGATLAACVSRGGGLSNQTGANETSDVSIFKNSPVPSICDPASSGAFAESH